MHINWFYDIAIVYIVLHIYLELCAPPNKNAKIGQLALLSTTYNDDGFDINACKEQQNQT